MKKIILPLVIAASTLFPTKWSSQSMSAEASITDTTTVTNTTPTKNDTSSLQITHLFVWWYGFTGFSEQSLKDWTTSFTWNVRTGCRVSKQIHNNISFNALAAMSGNVNWNECTPQVIAQWDLTYKPTNVISIKWWKVVSAPTFGMLPLPITPDWYLLFNAEADAVSTWLWVLAIYTTNKIQWSLSTLMTTNGYEYALCLWSWSRKLWAKYLSQTKEFSWWLQYAWEKLYLMTRTSTSRSSVWVTYPIKDINLILNTSRSNTWNTNENTINIWWYRKVWWTKLWLLASKYWNSNPILEILTVFTIGWNKNQST